MIKFQSCKIENDFSSWRKIAAAGILQDSLLAPLLFNIFISDITLMKDQKFVIMPMITRYLHWAKILTKLSEMNS